MLNAFLFSSTVFIWGTTWVAIAFQVGPVPVIVSVFHRFALAAVLLLGGLVLFGRLHRPRVWSFVIIQALFCFCFNFIALYNATGFISSGLVAVVFSLASIFNAINARLFLAQQITRQVIFSGAFGVAGLVLLLWDDLALSADMRTLQGVGWAVLGTFFFSLGNLASQKNSLEGVSPVIANAWGMGIGALVLIGIVWIAGLPMTIPQTVSYWIALVYLAVFGSVIGFTTYLTLVSRVGPAKAGYTTVLIPVIAMLASSVFEGYQWSWMSIAGLFLIGLGNMAMFKVRSRG